MATKTRPAWQKALLYQQKRSTVMWWYLWIVYGVGEGEGEGV